MADRAKFEFRAGEKIAKLTDQRKLELLQYIEVNGETRTAEELGVDRKTLQRLKQRRAEITQRVNALLVHRYNHHA